MARATALSLDDYKAKVGQEVGVSDWIEMTQERVSRFADVTEDHQFIHIDPDAAAKTPFGGTIAHGFLTLSLLTAMADTAMPGIEGVKMGVNYGLNKVRFMAPVRTGKRIRGRFTLVDVTERSPGVFQSTTSISVEIDGEPKPALAAEWLMLAYL